MNTLTSGRATDSPSNDVNDDYSGVILSSPGEIRQLREVVERSLQQDDTILDPEFFLASVSKGWEPRVVVVHSAREVIGIMYAQERVISGVPTGVVYADGSLGGVLLANSMHQRNAFRVAVETLLGSPKVRGVRLRVVRGGCEISAIRQLTASWRLDAHYSRIKYGYSPIWKHHAHLHLADSYEQFLMGLGNTTRRNFRYYRRRFEASGHSLREHLSMGELRSAVLTLVPKSTLANRPSRITIERALNLVAAARRPLAIGLKHHNGEWLSVIGGWYKPHGAVLFLQHNNNRDFGPYSLSVVLRAYLIESLIRERLNELVMWADTGPPLSRYVTYMPTIGVHLDVPTYVWRVARGFISTVGPWLPRRLASAAQWVVPHPFSS